MEIPIISTPETQTDYYQTFGSFELYVKYEYVTIITSITDKKWRGTKKANRKRRQKR